MFRCHRFWLSFGRHRWAISDDVGTVFFVEPLDSDNGIIFTVDEKAVAPFEHIRNDPLCAFQFDGIPFFKAYF